jgi:hypothetical protein
MPQSLYHLAQPTIPGHGLGSPKGTASGLQTVKSFPHTGRIPESRVPSEAGDRSHQHLSKPSRSSVAREQTSEFERKMVSNLDHETAPVLPARELLAECSLDPVCAPTPVPKSIVDFWATNTFEPEVMAALGLSKPRFSASGRVNRFVSHCWGAPYDYAEQTVPVFAAAHQDRGDDGLKDIAQRNYSKAKASELQQAGRKVASEMFGTESEWDKVTCWIDKVCIPQHDEAKKKQCVEHIEDFVRLSDGLIVLLSWNYFERLWCLYEWACFLVSHPATAVTVRLVPFPNLDNFSLWLSSVSNVCVQDAKCFVEADREILLHKVGQYYRGKSLDESIRKQLNELS